jgi:MFS family permease
MKVLAQQPDTPPTAQVPRRTGLLLAVCACHLVHDGLADVLYVLLPVWQTALDLSRSELGLLITLYFIALAVLQVPTGILAERTGERSLLIGGTAVAGLGFLVMGLTGGPAMLAVTLVLAGLGSSVQHPLGSTLVARAYGPSQRRIAIGTYNFSGDVGKMLFPILCGLALTGFAWQSITTVLGVLTLVSALAFLVVLRRMQIGEAPSPAKPDTDTDSDRDQPTGIHDRRRFTVLSIIAVFDTITRYGLLTLLPFLLIEQGVSESGVGLALGLLFAGGALGKFLCGVAAQRLGVLPTVWVTELVTAGGIVALLIIPQQFTLLLLPLIGAALNGTSSVLYGSVADYVAPEQQARGFGIFYTVVIASGAVSPVACGVLSDLASLETALKVVAAIALLAIPLSLLLKPDPPPV